MGAVSEIPPVCPSWMDDPSLPCKSMPTECFFPERGNPEPARKAKEACARCPHRADCLEWALRWEDHGIWGGMTRDERIRLRRQRKAVA